MAAGQAAAKLSCLRPWSVGVLAVSLTMALAGWCFGWPELAVPGLATVGLFGLGLVASLGHLPYQVDLAVDRQRVMVDQPALLELVISNSGSKMGRPCLFSLPIGRAVKRIRLGWLAAGGQVRLSVPLPTGQRALLPVGPVEVRQGDPFGLVGYRRYLGQPTLVTVYPKIISLPTGLAGLVRDLEGRASGQAAQADWSFHALRDWQLGDDRRAIHWLSSLRTGQLMVRQSEDLRRQQLALLLSTSAAEYAQTEDLELAASAVASLALAQLDQAGQVALLAGRSSLKLARAGRGLVLDQAAGWQLADRLAGGQSLAGLASRVRQLAPGASLVVMVTGGVLAANQLERLASYLPGQAQLVALSCHMGVASRVLPAGRLVVASLGCLADLPRVLRQIGLT